MIFTLESQISGLAKENTKLKQMLSTEETINRKNKTELELIDAEYGNRFLARDQLLNGKIKGLNEEVK